MAEQTEQSQPAGREEAAAADLRAMARDWVMHAGSGEGAGVDHLRALYQALSVRADRVPAQAVASLRDTLGGAREGLGRNLSKAAETASLAMREAASSGRQWWTEDMRPALGDVKGQGDAMVDSLGQVLRQLRDFSAREWHDGVTHAARGAADLRAGLDEVASDTAARARAGLGDGVQQTTEQARALALSVIDVAGGVLEGVAELLKERERS